MTLTNVPESSYDIEPLPGHPTCSSEEEGILVVTTEDVPLPPGVVPPGKFVDAKLTFANLTNAKVQDDEGDTIGAPDGISYQVMYTDEVAHPAPGECGFNDLSVPNLGIFSVEHRHYRHFQKGTLVSESGLKK